MRPVNYGMTFLCLITLFGCGENKFKDRLSFDQIKGLPVSSLTCKIFVEGRSYPAVDDNDCSNAIKLLDKLIKANFKEYHLDDLVDSDKDIVIRIIGETNKEKYLYFKYYDGLDFFSINGQERSASKEAVHDIKEFFENFEKAQKPDRESVKQ